MFLLNKDLSYLNAIKIADTEILWIDSDFYLHPDIVESYTDGALDERITPVYDFLKRLLYDYDYEGNKNNDQGVYIKTQEDGFIYNIDGDWNAIVSFDSDIKNVRFYERLEYNFDGDGDTNGFIRYKIGDLLYEREIEYNNVIIYNAKKFHFECDMNRYQVFHFKNRIQSINEPV